jgi:hypothetical protein
MESVCNVQKDFDQELQCSFCCSYTAQPSESLVPRTRYQGPAKHSKRHFMEDKHSKVWHICKAGRKAHAAKESQHSLVHGETSKNTEVG